MDFLRFCESYIHLHGRRICFDCRPYLPPIYAATGNLVLRCSRQVEKTTFLANLMIYQCIRRPHTTILFICPRDEQARAFSRGRLIDTIDQSPVPRRLLLAPKSRPAVKFLEFINGSRIYIRPAFRTADACRGLSADTLVIDEFQDVAVGMLPVVAETLSHSKQKRIILTGTPKVMDNALEAVFSRSSAHEWRVPCPGCAELVALDERAIGLKGLQCPGCATPLDAATGKWVARNPSSTWGHGYHINHLMVPWVTHDEILQSQKTYDPMHFKNEVLGLPTKIGDHVVTIQELEACCTTRAMAASAADIPAPARPSVVMGIDWTGGACARTVAVVGSMDASYHMDVWRMDRFHALDDVEAVIDALAEICRRLGVRVIAADGNGVGAIWNRLLVARLQMRVPIYNILYTPSDDEPQQEGALWQWNVGKTRAVSTVFGRVKYKKIRFPRAGDVASYLDEMACEIAVYNEEQRSTRYKCPEGRFDDALHALAYLTCLATREYHIRGQY